MADPWFKVHQSSFKEAFSMVMSAVETRSKIDILSHVLLSAENGVLTLRATDLDLQIDTECEAFDVAADIAVALPAERLRALVASLPETGEVSFGPGRFADQVAVSCGATRISMPCLPGADFPTIVTSHADHWFMVDGPELANAIGRTEFGLNNKEHRIYLTGFCLRDEEIDGKPILTVIATDGLSFGRVRCRRVEQPHMPAIGPNYRHVIVPRKGAEAIRKLFDASRKDCRLSATDATLTAASGGTTIVTKLVDAVYPIYDAVIPRLDGLVAECATADLVASVKRVGVVADNRDTDAIRFIVERDRIRLELVGTNGGIGADAIACQSSAETRFIVGMNGHQLLRLLDSVSTDRVRMHLTDGATGVVFIPDGKEDETYVLAPMRWRNAPGMEAEDAAA